MVDSSLLFSDTCINPMELELLDPIKQLMQVRRSLYSPAAALTRSGH